MVNTSFNFLSQQSYYPSSDPTVCMLCCSPSTASTRSLPSSLQLVKERLWFRRGMILDVVANSNYWPHLRGSSKLQMPPSCTRCANWSGNLQPTNKSLNNWRSCPRASDQNLSTQTQCSSTTGETPPTDLTGVHNGWQVGTIALHTVHGIHLVKISTPKRSWRDSILWLSIRSTFQP